MAQGVELATGYVSLTVDGSGLSRGINNAVNRAGSNISRSGGGIGSRLAAGMGKALKVGAVATGGAVAGLLGYSLTKGFQRLSAIDTAKKKLAGLGNSAKDIDKIMQNATASVKGTAFGLDEAATTAAGAVAAGIKPGKQLQGVLNTVADTATIAGSSMSDMGAIFGSVAARGKLQGDDLMQLQSRGVPVLAFLAKHYKTTAKEASVMVSKGQVDFKNFNAAMQENLGGAAKKSGDTVQGAFANLKASLGRIGAGMLAGVFPKVAPLLKNLTKALGPVEKVASDVGAKVGDGIATGFDLVGKAIGKVDWKGVGSAIGDVTGKAKQIIGVLFKGDFKGGPFQEDSPVIDFFFTLRENIQAALPKIRDFASQVGGKLSAGFSALLPHLKTFASGMLQVGKDIGPLAVAVGKTLVSAFQAAKPYLIAVGAVLAGAFVVALKVIPPILHTVVTALTGLFNIIRPILPIIAGAAAGFVAFQVATKAVSIGLRVVSAVTRAYAIAQGILNAVMSANPIMLVVIAIAALGAGLVLAYKKSETFRNIVNGAFGAVKATVAVVVGWFTRVFLPFFTQTIPNAFQSVLNFVRSHWKLILGLITGPIGAAVILVSSNWGKIKGSFSSAVNWVKGTFKKSWDAIKGVLQAPISLVRGFLNKEVDGWKAIFRGALTGIGKIWSGLKAIITSPINGVISVINKFASGIESLVNKIPGVNIKLGRIGQISSGSPVAVGHGGGRVAPGRGYARGGVLSGFTPVSHGDDRLVPMRSGEGVIVSEALRDGRSRAMIHAINHAALRGGASLSSLFGGGYSIGGVIGDIGGAVVGGIKDFGSILTNPLKWLREKILNSTLRKLGNSLPATMTKGLLKSAVSKIADLVSGSGGGGGMAVGGSGSGAPGSGWKWQWNLIHRLFPGVSLTSAFRPGAHTAGSGALSFHALGRAIDLGGPVSLLKRVALWIAQNYGAKSHDLLYTPLWGNMGLYNGSWYPQPANTVAMHRNHVHWGYARGGVVEPYRPPVFDQGGTLAPGINVVNNKLGRPEALVRADQVGERPIHIEVNAVPMDQAQNVAKELAFRFRQGGMLAGAF